MTSPDRTRWRFVTRGRDLRYERPEAPRQSNPSAVAAIRRAWDDHAIIDDTGQVWVGVAGLHVILRTSRERAGHFARGLEVRNRVEFENRRYIRGWCVAGRIDRDLQECATLIRSRYLGLSERHYQEVRDDAETQLIRARFLESLRQLSRKLKRERIRRYEIDADELTGDPLVEKGSHFAHVLSRSLYPEFVDCVWNGLVLNPETHERVTASGAMDDRELLVLCRRHRWRTTWHRRFAASRDVAEQR